VGVIGRPPVDYVSRIRTRYFMIPAIIIATGIVADRAAGKERKTF
jgi:hypothetical protein